MDLSLLIALIVATLLLVAIPGPNVALIIANTLKRGFRVGVMTVLGTTAGVGLQLAIVVLGLSTLLDHAATAFLWLKWFGVAYLLWLGITTWRQTDDGLSATASQKPAHSLFRQGLGLALINPKTLLFNAAFLPQFVIPESGTGGLFIVAVVYLVTLCLGDLVWAGTAHSARTALSKLGRHRHRLTGGLFITAGVGLALSRVQR